MRVAIALLFTVLVASTQCQQMVTLENCLYDIGVLAADLSLVYKDRSNRQYLSKARADLQTLFNHCAAVLPSSLGKRDCSGEQERVDQLKALVDKLTYKGGQVEKKLVANYMAASFELKKCLQN